MSCKINLEDNQLNRDQAIGRATNLENTFATERIGNEEKVAEAAQKASEDAAEAAQKASEDAAEALQKSVDEQIAEIEKQRRSRS